MNDDPCYIIRLIMAVSQLRDTNQACQGILASFNKLSNSSSTIGNSSLLSENTVVVGEGSEILERCCNITTNGQAQILRQFSAANANDSQTLLIVGFGGALFLLVLGLLLHMKSRFSQRRSERAAPSQPRLTFSSTLEEGGELECPTNLSIN